MKNYYFENLPTLFPTTNGFFDEIDSLMDKVFSASNIKKSFPYPVDIFNRVNPDTKKVTETVIQIALAGFTKDEIEVKAVKGQELTVKVSPVENTENVNYLLNGIARRSAMITWSLSDAVDLSDFRPKFQNGILTITLPIAKKADPDEIIGVIED